MTKRLQLLVLALLTGAVLYAKSPSPKRLAALAGTWRVTGRVTSNTVAAIRFDGNWVVMCGYGDTYTRFSCQVISSDILMLTDVNGHQYLLTIRRLTDNKLVFDSLFNVGRITLERVRAVESQDPPNHTASQARS